MRRSRLRALAELAVRFGANLQPGQILSLSCEPGKEQLARAIAEVAYQRGAKFVDLERSTITSSAPARSTRTPRRSATSRPWYGERVLALGDHRCATVYLSGPTSPHVMDGVAPELLGRDMLPHVKESSQVVNERTINWTAVPCPTADWGSVVYPELDPDAALAKLWDEVGYVCRLDVEDPVAAWVARMDTLEAIADG